MSRDYADQSQQPQQEGSGTTVPTGDEESEAEPPDLSLPTPLPPQDPTPSLGIFLGFFPPSGDDVGFDTRTGGVGSFSSDSSSSRETGFERALEAPERSQMTSGQQSGTSSQESRRQRRQSRRPASCTNCRARKVRCDKIIPCSQCFLRGISDTCAAPGFTGPPPNQIRGISDFARLEPPEQENESVLRRSTTSGSTPSMANPLRHQAPTTSQIRIEQHLAALERKVDRLTSAVERLGSSALALSSAQGQPTFPSDSMSFGAPHRNTRSEQLGAQAIQQLHSVREEQVRREQAAALSSLSQGPVRREQARALSGIFQSLPSTGDVARQMSLQTASNMALHSTNVTSRSSQRAPSYFPAWSEQQPQPADFPRLTSFSDPHVSLAEPENDPASFFSRTPDGSYTSILASLSLGGGEDTSRDLVPSTSSPD